VRKEVFPSLLKQTKWFKYKQDVQEGDGSFRRDETAARQTHTYAHVVRVHNGTDGKVWHHIHHKLPGEEKFLVIHNLIMVVPIEEQTFNDELGNKVKGKSNWEHVPDNMQGRVGEIHGDLNAKMTIH
jgi:hypothetical protein